MFIKSIQPKDAPLAIGPYSTATKLGDFVYLSGQIPVDGKTNEVAGEDIVSQTEQVMKNIELVLAEMNLEMRHIVKTTVFLSDFNNFEKFNEVYASYLSEPYPARSCVQVVRLPKDVLVEVECVVIDTLVYEQQMAAQNEGCSGCGGGCHDGEHEHGDGGCEGCC